MFALVTLVAGLAFLLVVHTLTPSWRWSATATALIAILFASAWVNYFTTPSYEGPLGEYGVQFFAEFTIGFVIAALIYFLAYLPAGENAEASVGTGSLQARA